MSSAGARGANERIIPLSRDERERSQGNLGYQSGWTLPARRTRRSLQQKRSDGQIIDKGLGCIFSAPLLGSKEKKRAAKTRLGVLSLRMPSGRGQPGPPGGGPGAEKRRFSSRPPATCSHFSPSLPPSPPFSKRGDFRRPSDSCPRPIPRSPVCVDSGPCAKASGCFSSELLLLGHC